MEARELFVLSVLTYAGLPLLIALAPTRHRFVMLYVYIASVLTLGGLLGAVYVLPLGGDISLLAGQISYGGFMFSTIVAVVVGRDIRVVRNIVLLVVTVNALVLAVFRISQHALEDGRVINPLGTPSAVFDKSVETVLLGGLLIIVELILILVVLEVAKSRLGTSRMVPVYLASYVGALALDGVLFPALVLRPETGLGALIHDQVLSKLVLAGAFSVPLLFFVVAYRPAVRGFEGAQLNLRQLVHVTRDELLERIDAQQTELAAQRDLVVRSDEDAATAAATVSSILDAATDTVLLAVDPQLMITAFNAGAERILGRSRSSVVGRSPTMFHTPVEVERHAAELGVEADYASVLRAQVASGERRDWELVVGDDERLVLSLSITEIEIDGRLLGYVIAGVDITDRLETEMALQSALEIEKGSLARLRETDSIKRSVVSTVSHELRTPITSIIAYTELMVEGDFGHLSDDQRQAAVKVRSNAARLNRIVDDLLTLDRAENVPLYLTQEVLDLRDVVTGCLDDVHELLDGHDHTLVVDLPDDPVMVSANLAGLQRVVDNLVGNALKFTPGTGTITISVKESPAAEPEAHLSVSDTGIGITENDREQIFERFYRATESTARAIPGSGLGLSIVAALVAHHDGRIEVDSTPGQGTTMTVGLPLAAASAPPGSQESSRPG